MSRLNRLMLTAVALGVAACGDDVTVQPPPPAPVTVVVTPDGATITVGGPDLQMNAAVSGGDGSAPTIVWSSSSTAVATVSNTGLVHAVSAGAVGITATATVGTSSGAGSATVTVESGVPALPPTVSIQSINSNATGAPVNLGAVAGQIDVSINLERNNNVIQRLEMLMKTAAGADSVVASQSFSTSAPVEASPELVPEQILFSVNTAAFNPTSGAVAFTNGANGVTVRAIGAGGTPTATNAVQFVLANVSGFQLALTNSGASAADGTGLLWTEGDVTLTATPVIYLAGVTVASVSIDPDLDCDAVTPGNQSGPLAIKSGTSGTWAKATAVGAGSQNYQTLAAGCSAGVTGSVLSNGQPGPTAPLGSVPLLRHDNLAPAGGTLVLTEQSGTVDCCSGNWFGTAYNFAAGHTAAGGGVAPTDAGVGIGTTTYHFGATSLTLAALVATPPVASGADVAETQTVTANNLAAKVCDKLNNCTNVALSSNGLSNTLTTAGADKTAPTNAYDVTSVAADAIFNSFTGVVGPHTFAGVGTDNLSSFGVNANAARSFGNFSLTASAQCFVPPVGYSAPFASGNCPFALQPSSTNSFAPASPFARYVTDERTIRDQAGNKPAQTLTRTILLDDIVPTVSNVAIPPSLVGGQPATFTAAATDGLDLGRASFSLEFAGSPFTAIAALSFSPVETISTFGEPLVTTHNASATVSFVRSLEAAGPAPSGVLFPASHARFLISDVAGNLAVQSNAFAVGTVPAGTSATALNVLGFQVPGPAAAQNICNAAGGCGTTPATPNTRTVTITATGAVGQLANPFTIVHVFWTDAFGVNRLAASTSAASSSTSGGTVTWTWTITFDATGLTAQANVPIFAVGIDPAGDGLYSAANTNISIVDPVP